MRLSNISFKIEISGHKNVGTLQNYNPKPTFENTMQKANTMVTQKKRPVDGFIEDGQQPTTSSKIIKITNDDDWLQPSTSKAIKITCEKEIVANKPGNFRVYLY